MNKLRCILSQRWRALGSIEILRVFETWEACSWVWYLLHISYQDLSNAVCFDHSYGFHVLGGISGSSKMGKRVRVGCSQCSVTGRLIALNAIWIFRGKCIDSSFVAVIALLESV